MVCEPAGAPDATLTLALDTPACSGQNGQVKRVSISEVKGHLAGLLHEVQQGETVLITHRGEPVARIEPCRTEHLAPDHAAAELVRRGLATAPRAPLDVDRVLDAKLPRISQATRTEGFFVR